jgi:hypothetical protein
MKRNTTLWVTLLAALVLVPLLPWGGGSLLAADNPEYGTFPFESAYVSSTADQTILSAPGTGRQWVVTGISYNVLVEEANATVLIKDDAGTAIQVCEFAPETQGFGVHYDFGTGVPCSTNSAVKVDLSGSTADVWIRVDAYKQDAD